MEKKQNIVGERIKSLRKEHKLTQKELALRTELPYQSIVNYEIGRRTPNASALAVLERYFNVSGEFICGHTEVRNKMSWNDNEIMNAVDQEMSTLLNNIYIGSSQCDEKSKKVVFDIFCEIRHILGIKNTYQKEVTLDALKVNVCTLTKFIDIYRSTPSGSEFEISRLVKIKDDSTDTISKTLDKLIQQLKEV